VIKLSIHTCARIHLVRRFVRICLAAALVAGAVIAAVVIVGPRPDAADTVATAGPSQPRDARAVTAAVRRAPRTRPRRPRTLPWRVRAARRWGASRSGRVAWAAIDTPGRLVGWHRGWQFPAASLSKAMLLVAELRRLARAGRHLDAGTRALLAPMIRLSDNDAADAIYRRVGDRGLLGVARPARMRAFGPAGWWSEARLTPADHARFFRRFGALTPRRWRPYARGLLADVVASQSWGIPAALRPRGWRVLFKGGWRPTGTGSLVHQAALLERGRRRLAIVILTDGNPSHAYGTETVRGIAARLLGRVG
jgi:hypothetical protein